MSGRMLSAGAALGLVRVSGDGRSDAQPSGKVARIGLLSVGTDPARADAVVQ